MSECTRHDWQPSEREGDPHPWRCAECDETSASCSVCERASGTSLLICTRCEQREAHILADIERIMAHDDGAGVDWGEVRTIDRSVRRRDAGVHQEDRNAPPTVDSRLQGWVARWAEHSGSENTSATDYLHSRIIWAVHNPTASDWRTYRGDVRSIRAHALATVGLAPQKLVDRCMHCNGKLVQDRADMRGLPFVDGRQEEVRCTRCGLTWHSPEQARLHARQRVRSMPENEPDVLVTLEHAHQIWPFVPTAAMRKWVHRDRLEHERSIAECDAWDDHWTDWHDAGNVGPVPEPPEFYDRQLPELDTREDGRSLYRLGDLTKFTARRYEQGRLGRRAG